MADREPRPVSGVSTQGFHHEVPNDIAVTDQDVGLWLTDRTKIGRKRSIQNTRAASFFRGFALRARLGRSLGALIRGRAFTQQVSWLLGYTEDLIKDIRGLARSRHSANQDLCGRG